MCKKGWCCRVSGGERGVGDEDEGGGPQLRCLLPLQRQHWPCCAGDDDDNDAVAAAAADDDDNISDDDYNNDAENKMNDGKKGW